MRKLFVIALTAALAFSSQANAQSVKPSPYSNRPESEQPDTRNRWREMTRRTGTIWLPGQPCQAMTIAEIENPVWRTALSNARRALDSCAFALQTRVIGRLDGRGDLALASSLGAIGGLAAGGTHTIEAFGVIGVLPIYYEGLQSGRMTSIEFFSAHGVSWIRQQSSDLSAEFEALRRRRDALEVSLQAVDQAALLVSQELDCLNAEIARTNGWRTCAARAAPATPATLRSDTRAQLGVVLSEMTRAQTQARQILRAADAELEREQYLPIWIRERFDRLRYVALGQQMVSRVGPQEAFRSLLAAPFGVVADTLRGTSTAELTALQVQVQLQRQLDGLAQPMGLQTSTLQVADVTYDRSKVSNAQRALFVAQQVSVVQNMVELARTTNSQIVRLYTADTAPLRVIQLPST